MNRVILCGRLTREPEIRYSQTANGSMAVARYTLAVDRAFKKEGEQAADFINCIAFGKNGEFAEKYLHKGTKIIVEGRWQTGNYTNKDGQKVYTNDCVDCFTEDTNTYTCEKCGKKFTMYGYQAGWKYHTETIDGEATEKEIEDLQE